MRHGLRLHWGAASAHIEAEESSELVHRVELPAGGVGVVYGPVTSAQAQTLVAAVVDGRLPDEPAVPWCAVLHDPNGVVAAASTQFASGLFWRADPFVIATDPRAAAGASPGLDLAVIRSLVSGHPEPERTVYAGVHRLPPGSVARWMSPTRAPSVAYASDDWPEPTLRGAAASQALLAALDAACAAAAGTGPVSLMLSGGLDSTMLASLLVEQAPVTGLTYRPNPQARLWLADGADADEGSLVRLLAEALAPRLRVEDLITPPQVRPLAAARRAFERSGVPVHNPANQWWIDAARLRALSLGSRVVVTGAHGNAAFSYDHPYAVSRALRHGRLGDLANMGRDESGRITASSLRRRVLRPLRPGAPSPPSIPALGIRPSGGAGVHDRTTYLTWLARRFTGLPAASNPAATEGILLADPFAAPVVLRVAAAIDPAEWRMGGRGRALARRIAAGRVPDAIRLRTKRGQQGRDAWWLIRDDRDEYLDRVATARNQPGFEGVEWASVHDRVEAWPWASMQPPDWREQVAVDRLLSLAEFVLWVDAGAGRSLPA